MLSIAMEEGIRNKFQGYIEGLIEDFTYRNTTDESIKQFQSVESIGEYILTVLSGNSVFFHLERFTRMFTNNIETIILSSQRNILS